MNRPLNIAALIIALLTFTRTAIAQPNTTTIDVRTTVTLPAGSPVLLKHIATLAGPDAERLATAVILHADEAKPVASTTLALTRDAIRVKLDNAAVSWPRTLLRAGTTTITFTASPATAAPAPQPSAAAPAPLSATPAPAPAAAPSDPRSLRSLILNALADAAGSDIAISAISLRTENLPPSDAQLLSEPLPPSWQCHIKIMGATPSGRTSIKIEAFDADRVTLSKTITLEALVRRDVLIVAPGTGLARDQVITPSDLRFETRLMPVTESARIPALTVEQFANGVTAAKRRIDAGKPILPTDAAAMKGAIVVKRGDEVQVSCLAGGILLKSKAKSLGSARDGELVQLQVEGSKKVISARMNGPGKAVIALDPAPDAPPTLAAN